MFTTLRVPLNKVAVVYKNGVPTRVLGPGKHRIWGGGITITKFDTDELLFDAPRQVRALLPSDWFDEVMIALRQRAILYRDGRPAVFLRPGAYRFWTVDPSVELRVLSIDDPVPEMTDELRRIIPAGELVDVTVQQHQRGLKYVQGTFQGVLGPGRHAFWSHPEAQVAIKVLDVRQQLLNITGQELMTRDKVTLRLTLTAEWAPADAAVSTHTVADVKDSIYLAVQLAARDYVAGVTLDELLEGRDAMTRHLEETVRPQVREFGIEIRRVGVKDIVLPGEMKLLLNRVIEAEKQAAAQVILRREDAAATRQLANTAKVMADNPVLLDLKRLEALEKMAGNVADLRLVVGSDVAGLLKGVALRGDKD